MSLLVNFWFDIRKKMNYQENGRFVCSWKDKNFVFSKNAGSLDIKGIVKNMLASFDKKQSVANLYEIRATGT